MFTFNLEKGLDYREIGDKFPVGGSTACEKVNTPGTDENLFRNLCLGTNRRLCSD